MEKAHSVSGLDFLGCVIVWLPLQEVMKKLEDAANNTKSWKDKVAHHEGLIRIIQPGKHHLLLPGFCPSPFQSRQQVALGHLSSLGQAHILIKCTCHASTYGYMALSLTL